MWVLKFFIEKLNTDEKILLERYKSSKIIFVISSFLFFITFFLIWSWFNDEFFLPFFTYLYVLTLFSLIFFLYFTIKMKLFWYFSAVAFSSLFLLMFIIGLFLLKFVS